MEILILELAGQRYGLAMDDVREVAHAVTISPLPKAPAIVEGVINVRGTVTAVLDIRGRFGHPAKPLAPGDHLVLAHAGDRDVAIRVDRAVELVALDSTDVEEATKSVPRAEYVAGVAKLPDGLVLIHDLATFLSEAEAMELDEALTPAEAGP